MNYRNEVRISKYGGHAATLLVYFIFRVARVEDRTRDCLTAARRATCGLRRHPNEVGTYTHFFQWEQSCPLTYKVKQHDVLERGGGRLSDGPFFQLSASWFNTQETTPAVGKPGNFLPKVFGPYFQPSAWQMVCFRVTAAFWHSFGTELYTFAQLYVPPHVNSVQYLCSYSHRWARYFLNETDAILNDSRSWKI